MNPPPPYCARNLRVLRHRFRGQKYPPASAAISSASQYRMWNLSSTSAANSPSLRSTLYPLHSVLMPYLLKSASLTLYSFDDLLSRWRNHLETDIKKPAGAHHPPQYEEGRDVRHLPLQRRQRPPSEPPKGSLPSSCAGPPSRPPESNDAHRPPQKPAKAPQARQKSRSRKSAKPESSRGDSLLFSQFRLSGRCPLSDEAVRLADCTDKLEVAS